MAYSLGAEILQDQTHSVAFTGQTWRPNPSDPQYFATPNHFGPTKFNPTSPDFTPIGTELTRYRQQPTPPSSGNTVSRNMNGNVPAMGELQRFMASNHVKHTQDVARVELMSRKNNEEINNIKEIVGNDLRQLQSQLCDLQVQVNRGGRKHETEIGVLDGGSGILKVDMPSAETLLQRFDKNIVAQLYIEQADVLEATVQKLRQDARELGAEEVELQMEEDDDEVETPTHKPAHRVQHKPTHEEKPVQEETPAAVEVKAEDKQQVTEPQTPTTAAEVATPTSTMTITPTNQATEAQLPTGRWIPRAVREMPPSAALNKHEGNNETFSWEFLTTTFGGKHWSPGYYFVPKSPVLPSKAYWLLEAEYEPHLPSTPGEHGAKLTAFFNSTLTSVGNMPDEENYKNTPVFVRAKGQNEYVYFGHYSQLRFSDRLDYDTIMEHVPLHVREYWAKQLTASNRPAWVTQALMDHIFDKPKYLGPIPTDSAINTPKTIETSNTALDCKDSGMMEKRVRKALEEYVEELKQWYKDSLLKVTLLKESDLLKSFEAADADMEPGLRLWWEYMQCVSYEQEFYAMLCKFKYMPLAPKAIPSPPRAKQASAPKRRAEVGGADKATDNVQAALQQHKYGLDGSKLDSNPKPKPHEKKLDQKKEEKKIEKPADMSDWEEQQPEFPPDHPAKPVRLDTISYAPVRIGSVNATPVSSPRGAVVSGDLEAAKQFQKGVTKAKPSGRGGNGFGNGFGNGNGGGRGPPHLRR
jgi:hypothetical protein